MIQENETVSYVVERDIDLAVVQLVRTSSDFRNWFVNQLNLDRPVTDFIGIRQSVTTSTGESDIEVGLETNDGNHIVLIENKIDASMQDRQVERYFERGEDYLDQKDWDSFTVCLTAPESYIGQSEEQGFEAIVTYEEMMEKAESIEHDGSEFVTALFEESLSKRSPTDNSDLTSEVTNGILSDLGEPTDIRSYQKSNTQVRLESTHERHPWFVLYNAYIPGSHDGDKAIVRINLTGRQEVSTSEIEEEIEEVRPIFEENQPEEFEYKDRSMDIVRKDLVRDEFSSQEEYINSIISELRELIEFYHPTLVQERYNNNLSSRPDS
jgi:hypothetical protein